MNNQIKLPWFKQPLVWMIIAIPASAVFAGFYTLYLAISTDDGLVADDYYKQGMTINRQLKRDETAARLKLAADTEIDTQTGFVKVKFDKGMLGIYPDKLRFTLRHATQQQQDHSIVLQHGEGNLYVGAVSQVDQAGIYLGVWHLELSNTDRDDTVSWRLSRRVQMQGLTTVLLVSD